MNVCMSYKILQYDRIDVPEGIDINKTSASKDVILVIIGILKMLVINFNNMFVIVAVVYQRWLIMS